MVVRDLSGESLVFLEDAPGLLVLREVRGGIGLDEPDAQARCRRPRVRATVGSSHQRAQCDEPEQRHQSRSGGGAEPAAQRKLQQVCEHHVDGHEQERDAVDARERGDPRHREHSVLRVAEHPPRKRQERDMRPHVLEHDPCRGQRDHAPRRQSPLDATGDQREESIVGGARQVHGREVCRVHAVHPERPERQEHVEQQAAEAALHEGGEAAHAAHQQQQRDQSEPRQRVQPRAG